MHRRVFSLSKIRSLLKTRIMVIYQISALRPSLFINKLLHSEFVFQNFFFLEYTYSIDPCQTNSNLLATGGGSQRINIYDKRNSQIVKRFEDMHYCKRILSLVLASELIPYINSLYSRGTLCEMESRWH